MILKCVRKISFNGREMMRKCEDCEELEVLCFIIADKWIVKYEFLLILVLYGSLV